MVSVVIPCYNQGRFLGEAIESVLAQTGGDSEIVVVDDGSTDDTAAVASRYGVRYISQRNQGQAAARNNALAHVSGEFVVFLDSDDRLLPCAFEVGLRALSDHPGCAFTAGRCIVFGPDGPLTDVKYEPVVERDHYRSLLRNNFIWMPGVTMFRTAIVRSVGGFRTAVTGAEDYDLYLRVARLHPFWCHDEFVAEYRQHDGNTTRRAMQMLRSLVKTMESQRPWVKDDPATAVAWRQGLRFWQQEFGERVMDSVRIQLRNGQWREAAPLLLGLMRYYPRGVRHHAKQKIIRIARGEKPEALDVT
jgi:glycosyltransferase involved in cell wall biosynthesis